ncbi:MAG: transcription antitermination factor NusB [Acholeplasmataceae bacterium]
MNKTTFKKQKAELMYNLYQYDLFSDLNQANDANSVTEENQDTYQKIIANLANIDQAIEDNLYNYSLNRLSFVDRAIIRLATYELLYTDYPISFILNDAIDLTKKYSNLDDDKQRKFNNKLLDTIAKAVRKDQK